MLNFTILFLINLFGHVANLNVPYWEEMHPCELFHGSICMFLFIFLLHHYFFLSFPDFCFCFCYVFFCFLAKLRLAMHDASSSPQSRALIDKKLQIYVRKERSLQDRMQQQQPVQPPPTCHPAPGGNMTQSTR